MRKGIWVQVRNFYKNSRYYDGTQLQLAKKFTRKGITHVYTGFTVPETEPIIEKFVRACYNEGIDVYLSVNVMDYEYLSDVLDRIQYILDKDWPIKGLVLDYIRFKNFSPLNIFKTKEITDCVSIIRDFLPQQYELHAAVKSSWYSSKCLNKLFGLCWGVNYTDIAYHLDAICPMVYTGLYKIPNTDVGKAQKYMDSFIKEYHFEDMNLICLCEPILQTYYDEEEDPDMYDLDLNDLTVQVGLTNMRFSMFMYQPWRGWMLDVL